MSAFGLPVRLAHQDQQQKQQAHTSRGIGLCGWRVIRSSKVKTTITQMSSFGLPVRLAHQNQQQKQQQTQQARTSRGIGLCGCRVIRSAEVKAAGQEPPTGMLASGEVGSGMTRLRRSVRPDAVTEGTAKRREDRPAAAEAETLAPMPQRSQPTSQPANHLNQNSTWV
ncbi:hypothetical protein CQW29_21815 [Pantoea coffeiphila]|uniref:Uncharacterized protein n=1 Tax=Pantoea coffeiphila TaxID=1465635 RepID=A0A2S9I669_9GAMM|nr:hypothetical protein CQW29_21815 [Pantoea coffeiphila]